MRQEVTGTPATSRLPRLVQALGECSRFRYALVQELRVRAAGHEPGPFRSPHAGRPPGCGEYRLRARAALAWRAHVRNTGAGSRRLQLAPGTPEHHQERVPTPYVR